ncbi:hypothetical protein JTB14_002761 [Gonioctena quinquepunctata]|nr:hypothetical protein JTB14_002761 [Gonioctena quinquepunctata]
MGEDKGGKDPPDKFIRQENLYQYTDSGPFEIYIQCNNKNIGNYHILGIAKTVLDMKLTDVKKINKKGKNRISVEFKTFQAANELAKNEELKKKGYDVFIPINKVTCKGIVKPLDKEFSDEILKEYSEIKTPINCRVLNVRRFTVRNKKQKNLNQNIYHLTQHFTLFRAQVYLRKYLYAGCVTGSFHTLVQ